MRNMGCNAKKQRRFPRGREEDPEEGCEIERSQDTASIREKREREEIERLKGGYTPRTMRVMVVGGGKRLRFRCLYRWVSVNESGTWISS